MAIIKFTKCATSFTYNRFKYKEKARTKCDSPVDS